VIIAGGEPLTGGERPIWARVRTEQLPITKVAELQSRNAANLSDLRRGCRTRCTVLWTITQHRVPHYSCVRRDSERRSASHHNDGFRVATIRGEREVSDALFAKADARVQWSFELAINKYQCVATRSVRYAFV
jgi:hypothetical protein